MAGEDLNYYYFGHLMAAGLVRLSAVAPDVGYNLAVATFFALSVVAAFGLAYALGGRAGDRAVGRRAVHRRGDDRLRARAGRAQRAAAPYDWFGASRVIEGTINEFPAFSFTLADLHGHVMAIPFSLLALAFGLQVAIERAGRRRRRGPGRARAGLRGDRDRDAVRDQRLVVPGHRRAGRAGRRWCGCATRRACASAPARSPGWLVLLLLAVLAGAAVPAHLRRGRRRLRRA